MANAKRNARRDEKAARPKPAPRVSLEQSPARTVVLRRIADLREHPRNVRTHPVAQLAVLDESFSEHGQVKPLVINRDGVLLAGHGSREALLNVYGPEAEVACVIVDQDDTLQRKFMLRDNAGAAMSGWNKDGLGLELADLKGLGVADLGKLGFKPAELKRLMPEGEREGAHDPDADAPPAPDQAVSRPGDIWLLGDHRLMCGDCTHADHVAALLGTDRPHLMVTDQPYGVEYDPTWSDGGITSHRFENARARGLVANDDRADWRAAWALFPGDVAYVWHADCYSHVLADALIGERFDLRALVIWAKPRHVMSRGDYHYQHEQCWYAVRKGATGHWQGSRSETTLWSIEHQKSETGHSTQKPIECMKRPIKNNSAPGDCVYEPFSGSGTTVIAGEMLARRVLALEIVPAYVDVSVLRWEGFAKKTAILAATGETWAAVRARRVAEALAEGPAPQPNNAVASDQAA
jgi:DNA modification methylase